MRDSDIDVLIALVPGMRRAFDEMLKEGDRWRERYLYPLTVTRLAVDIMLWSALIGRDKR